MDECYVLISLSAQEMMRPWLEPVNLSSRFDIILSNHMQMQGISHRGTSFAAGNDFV